MIRDIEGAGPGTQREMMTRDGECFSSVSAGAVSKSESESEISSAKSRHCVRKEEG